MRNVNKVFFLMLVILAASCISSKKFKDTNAKIFELNQEIISLKKEKIKLETITLELGERITSNTVKIYNPNNNKISLFLGISAENLTEYGISGNENWLGPNFPNDPLVRIITRSKSVQDTIKEYTLIRGRSYIIIWNTEESCWDIKKLKI